MIWSGVRFKFTSVSSFNKCKQTEVDCVSVSLIRKKVQCLSAQNVVYDTYRGGKKKGKILIYVLNWMEALRRSFYRQGSDLTREFPFRSSMLDQWWIFKLHELCEGGNFHIIKSAVFFVPLHLLSLGEEYANCSVSGAVMCSKKPSDGQRSRLHPDGRTAFSFRNIPPSLWVFMSGVCKMFKSFFSSWADWVLLENLILNWRWMSLLKCEQVKASQWFKKVS